MHEPLVQPHPRKASRASQQVNKPTTGEHIRTPDVSRHAVQMGRSRRTSHGLVMAGATRSAGDDKWETGMPSGHQQPLQQLGMYVVQPAPAFALKFVRLEKRRVPTPFYHFTAPRLSAFSAPLQTQQSHPSQSARQLPTQRKCQPSQISAATSPSMRGFRVAP